MMIPTFILFGRPPISLSKWHKEVPIDDPVRYALSALPSFETAITSIKEGDYNNYSFFIQTRNPVNGRIHNETNLFFERDRKFTLFAGPFRGVQLQPLPPIRVYRIVRQSPDRHFMNDKRVWLTDNIFSRIISQKTDTICFVAGDKTRDVQVNNLVYKELRVAENDNVVPLLVMSSTDHSLDFAEFVMELIHCCTDMQVKSCMQQYSGLIQNLSIDRLRKMYDIFPEAFIQIPRHVWNHFRYLDNYELTHDDVHELSTHYQKMSLS